MQGVSKLPAWFTISMWARQNGWQTVCHENDHMCFERGSVVIEVPLGSDGRAECARWMRDGVELVIPAMTLNVWLASSVRD